MAATTIFASQAWSTAAAVSAAVTIPANSTMYIIDTVMKSTDIASIKTVTFSFAWSKDGVNYTTTKATYAWHGGTGKFTHGPRETGTIPVQELGFTPTSMKVTMNTNGNSVTTSVTLNLS